MQIFLFAQEGQRIVYPVQADIGAGIRFQFRPPVGRLKADPGRLPGTEGGFRKKIEPVPLKRRIAAGIYISRQGRGYRAYQERNDKR